MLVDAMSPRTDRLAWARIVAATILDAALPPRCVGCDTEGDVLCPACAPALDARLAAPAGWPIGMPAELPSPLVQLEWSAPYAGIVRAALHALKYRGERRLARPLAAAAARRWQRVGAGGDLVVPVPVHRAREAERGYDQSVLLAAAVAPHLGLPTVRAIVRRRATARQFDLDRGHRRANVSGAFIVPNAMAGVVAGRWVVLVDDVVTTGSTMAACGAVLMAAGALAVSAVAVARER
jgi:ComF family protein